MIRRFVVNYLARHRSRSNQLLHLVGVPLTFLVSLWMCFQQQWLWAAAAFFAGYVLQFAGHAIEGNDAGEAVLIKRWLGRPYVEFGPVRELSKLND